jgi:long-chain acyl-CoA synthetase
MNGYFNDPEASRQAFRDGFFRTGDVGYQDAAGYFYLSDRLKDMIDTGGEKVYCGEVEASIQTISSVSEVAVFGIPDPKWGEIVMACVVLKPGCTLTADDLVANCRRLLTHYKVPRRVEFLRDALPRNASGKIMKRTLRERYWTGYERRVG